MSKLRMLVDVVTTFRNWPVHVLDYLNVGKKKDVIFRMRNGVNLHARLRTFDSMAIREVWIRKDYTPPGFEIGRDAVVVDVGGHIGSFALLAARAASAGRVYVFEPTSENFSLLQKNIQLNAASNIASFNLALLGRSGARVIGLSPGNTVSHSFFFNLPGAEQVEVQAISLSEFMQQQNLSRIDFMKLDCEGAEYEILFECEEQVLSRIQKISAEVHDMDERRNRSTYASFLKSKGFEVSLGPPGSPMIYARRPSG